MMKVYTFFYLEKSKNIAKAFHPVQQKQRTQLVYCTIYNNRVI